MKKKSKPARLGTRITLHSHTQLAVFARALKAATKARKPIRTKTGNPRDPEKHHGQTTVIHAY